ncbi:MAG: T9SS type A sorting domain-containing protein [Bacteroidota bacterium]
MKNKYFYCFSLVLFISFVHGQEEPDFFFEKVDRYIYSPNHEKKRSKDYFKRLKEMSETGNQKAYYFLGLYQKEGIGTQPNLKKSLRSFKKAYELGDPVAAYSVGYYYLKGLGEVEQDYIKAYRWFKKSQTPMAKHWMAKMEFLGLGREKNKKKAIKILKENELYNSKVLLPQYEENQDVKENPSDFSDFLNTNSINSIHSLSSFHDTPEINFLEGKWIGEYLELEWSKNKPLRILPIELEIAKNEGINGALEALLRISDSTAKSSGNYNAGSLRFTNLSMPVKKKFTDYPNFTHLITDISEIELRSVQAAGENLLLGRIKTYHPVWKEPGNPVLILLRKETTISEEAARAFELQSSDFVKIYPNPVPNYCLINYELPLDSKVKIEISNYYNTPRYHRTIFDGTRLKGEHTLEIFELPSAPGSYIVSIVHNGKKETKIIIKQ